MNTNEQRRKILLTMAAMTAGHGGLAVAQDGTWPTRPIRLIVPFPPGGGTDFLSRTVAVKVAEATGWSVVPDNRAGAGGTIGLGEAAKAETSGHTMVMAQLDNLVIAPQFYRNLPYDPLRDFTPVALVGDSPILFAVNASSKFHTLADVIAAAKKDPDGVTYASPGAGTVTHLAAELFANAAGIKLRHIPYKGSTPALTDVLGGQVQILTASIASASSHIKAGKLRPLAVTSPRRSTALPDAPTVAEQGFPKFDVVTWYAVFAPKGAPSTAVTRFNAEVNRALRIQDVQAAILSQGAEARPTTPEALAILLQRETEKWRASIAAAGIKLDLS